MTTNPIQLQSLTHFTKINVNLIISLKIDDTKLTKKCKTNPILKLTQMPVTNVLTSDYNRVDTQCRGKNEPKTNPMVCYSNSTKMGS